jgi:hypothetical protein
MVIWYIYGYLVHLWLFGTFMVIWYIYGYLVHLWLFGTFMVIWNIFPVLVCCTKKNLATLNDIPEDSRHCVAVISEWELNSLANSD